MNPKIRQQMNDADWDDLKEKWFDYLEWYLIKGD